MSRLVLPVGSVATIVPGNGVSAPSAPIANPEMVDVAELEVYTKCPSGVTACQQVAAPWVGTLALMGETVPLGSTAYDEIAEALFPPAGPVSDTSAAPFGANHTANAGANSRSHNNRTERTVQLDMEGINSVVELLCQQEKLTVGAERQRTRPRVAGGEERDGMLNRPEFSVMVEREAYDVAASPRV